MPPALVVVMRLIWSSLTFGCIAHRMNAVHMGGLEQQDASVSSGDDSSVEVNFIVTRHALSCANVVAMWGGVSGKAMQKLQSDPVLAAVGEQGSIAMGEVIAEKYGAGAIDGVVSSVLIRAMQTALLQYPGHQVQVMPYLRESGAKVPLYGEVGLDNLPTGELRFGMYKMATEDAQTSKLEQAIEMSPNADVALSGSVSPLSAIAGSKDLAELTKLRKTKGSWEDFKEYFGKTYLPKLVEMKKIATGKSWIGNLTVAVVTHSNFMKDSKEATEVQDNCGFAWADTPSGKPLNNQAVLLQGSRVQQIYLQDRS